MEYGPATTRAWSNLGSGIDLPANAVAAALNVTSSRGTAPTSFVTVHPTGVARPFASSSNTREGTDLAAGVLTPLSNGFSIYNNSGSVYLYVDVAGYFAVAPWNL